MMRKTFLIELLDSGVFTYFPEEPYYAEILNMMIDSELEDYEPSVYEWLDRNDGSYFEADHHGELAMNRRHAERGHDGAQHILGKHYYYGLGVLVDYEEAVKWWLLSANQGNTISQYDLANCYRRGLGVTKNIVEAARLYRLNAEQGDVEAQYNLGCCYYHGNGVLFDIKEAIKWWLLAADKGCVQAQYNLGVVNCYRDSKEAVKWWRMAAEAEISEAQYNLGCCLANAIGVDQNDMEAYFWFLIACERGIEKARLACYLIEDELTAQQQSKVHDRYLKWFEERP